jgi:UDP-N-acetylglucosamine--N-acetylmuramyl-(pentapeptide) pyrophosphoryl-undecaprenol N-acetylglucosamine transferase
MKILLTGGGTGGHFYPLIAVAEELNSIVDQEKILEAKLYYMSDTPYDKAALFENGISYIPIVAGKRRLYSSVQNFFDIFKMGLGCAIALLRLFFIYPDVVFSKGGYASFPALLSARILRIPVVIHESDSSPGRVSIWAGKFARRIALSYPEAAVFFPAERTAVVGQPIRKEIRAVAPEGAFEYLGLNPDMPTILILGGSLGAETINDAILTVLPKLLEKYQVIHQTGQTNYKSVTDTVSFIVKDKNLALRYKAFPFLNNLALTMAAGASTIVITRAGSMLFEIASWKIPAIVIPITASNGDHQRKNAYAYAKTGAGIVIEENNLTEHVLLAEIDNLIGDPERRTKMSKNATLFVGENAAKTIATELINIALEHEE